MSLLIFTNFVSGASPEVFHLLPSHCISPIKCHSLQPPIFSSIISAFLPIVSRTHHSLPLCIFLFLLSPLHNPFTSRFASFSPLSFLLPPISHPFPIIFFIQILSLSFLPLSLFPRGYYLSRSQICPIINLISALCASYAQTRSSCIHLSPQTRTFHFCLSLNTSKHQNLPILLVLSLFHCIRAHTYIQPHACILHTTFPFSVTP